VRLVARALVALVALEHLGFLVLEMFLFTKPVGRKVFGVKREDAETMKVLAANQGLYNGFLAAGLIWGLVAVEGGLAIQTFFLVCVLIAGLYGGATASRAILLVQALPAAIALVVVRVAAGG